MEYAMGGAAQERLAAYFGRTRDVPPCGPTRGLSGTSKARSSRSDSRSHERSAIGSLDARGSAARKVSARRSDHRLVWGEAAEAAAAVEIAVILGAASKEDEAKIVALVSRVVAMLTRLIR